MQINKNVLWLKGFIQELIIDNRTEQRNEPKGIIISRHRCNDAKIVVKLLSNLY